MTINPSFLAALAIAGETCPGPRILPWPAPKQPGGIVEFADFAAWQAVIFGFRLSAGVPLDVVNLFDRALKLYLVAWLDFDLVTAGEVVAFAALEHSLRDRYLDYFRKLHATKTIAQARSKKQDTTINKQFRAESIPLSVLLKHMVKQDDLTDDHLNCVRKYGGSVIKLISGDTQPSLAQMRNNRAHGGPFGSGYQAGLLDLIRDLIEYAYRDRLEATIKSTLSTPVEN